MSMRRTNKHRRSGADEMEEKDAEVRGEGLKLQEYLPLGLA